MSFLATAKPPIPEVDAVVDNDPRFPAIDAARLRATCRLDGTVTPARLQRALMDAMASVNSELATYMLAQGLLGYATLADVPAIPLGGESVKLHHYRRAVYACVQADLSEVYREVDTTPAGNGKQERVGAQLEIKADAYRRAMRWAISDLLGRPRTTVDLV